MRNTICSILFLFAAVCLPLNAQQTDYSIPYPKALSSPCDTITLTVIGDIMMHSRQLEYDHRVFLSGISDDLLKSDYSAGNLEFPLGGAPYSGYPAFSTPDSYPEYLASNCGINIFLTANNHVTDRGASGLKRTLSIYDDMASRLGIQYTGTSSGKARRTVHNPLILRRHGITIALANFTYGTNSALGDTTPIIERMNKEEVAGNLRRAKESGADFIIALPHWGEEYRLRHNSSQQQWAEFLVSRGADAIIGSHPHVVQDSTHIKGVPVFYSIGNAISNMSAPNTQMGLMVKISFVIDHSSGRKKMLEPEFKAIWCCLPGAISDNYGTIFIKEWANRKNDWLTLSDYEKMMSTYRRVKHGTGIKD